MPPHQPFPVYYAWPAVPDDLASEKTLLKSLRRLNKGAAASASLVLVFDHPRRGRVTLPPADCDGLRQRLGVGPPSADDLRLLDELRAAGQALDLDLFRWADSTPISSLTEVEAQRLLSALLFDGSHEEDYITEAAVGGQRQRRTWKRFRSDPDLAKHLRGERQFGPKRGSASRLIAIDLDRHSGKVAGDYHLALVMATGEALARRYPEMRFAPEVNLRNGSTKYFGWAASWLPIQDAIDLAETIRRALAQELPGHDWARVEIYPSSSPQVFAPLRPDKATVIGDGRVQMVARHRYEKVSGRRRRVECQAMSAAQYLNWVFFSQTAADRAALEQALRAGLAACPDAAPDEPAEASLPAPPPAAARLTGTGVHVHAAGRAELGPLKGRCARVLIDFWSGVEIPPDTIGTLLIVTLRVLKAEGLAEPDALQWVEERLLALDDTSFSDRLSGDFGELMRVTRAAARAVWADNGYQTDPQSSSSVLAKVVAIWGKRGFRLHDPDTWDAVRQGPADSACPAPPRMRLVWTASLTAMIPSFAAVAVTTVDKAKKVMESILVFVGSQFELSESKVGQLLSSHGVKGKWRGKQHAVRKFLVDQGVIVLHKNYVSDVKSHLRHGNFYFPGPEVDFSTADDQPGSHWGGGGAARPPVSNYLSVSGEPLDEIEARQEARRLACERRFLDRRRHTMRRSFRRTAVAADETLVTTMLKEAYLEFFPDEAEEMK
jgi:hypothetical protein